MRGETILVVDDEKLIRWSLRENLQRAGFQTLEADAIAAARTVLRDHDPDLILLDQMLPDGTGIQLLTELRRERRMMPVVMLTGLDRANVAVQAMKLGAFEYVTKPVDIEELLLVIEKALEESRLRRQVAHFLRAQEQRNGFCGMVGSSQPMREIFDRVTRIAGSRGTTVLITGESGTGKELVARAVHFLSDRKDQPLMTVNCSALSETLIESELFGHEKGAFTDARNQKKGIFEVADGGTIFFDEIGDVSPKVQAKLLRVLEHQTFQRVGGTVDIHVDVRIIAATNVHLDAQVAAGAFRADLFYRLNVAAIHMPPLRDRGDDVIELTAFAMTEFNAKFRKHYKGLARETEQLFKASRWPGNVRELRNVLERAILLGDGEWIQPGEIEFARLPGQSGTAPAAGAQRHPAAMSLDDIERRALVHALEQSAYNQSEAARALRITRDTLRYRMKKHGLSGRPGKPPV